MLVPVSMVYGTTTRYRAGDVTAVPAFLVREGTSLLVPTNRDPPGQFISFRLDAHGRIDFYDSVTRVDLTLTRAQLLQALFSHDCVETLAAIDTRWRDAYCGGGGSVSPRPPATTGLCSVETTGGCGARVTPSAEGDAVVLAMIGALLLRRAARVGVVGDGVGRR